MMMNDRSSVFHDHGEQLTLPIPELEQSLIQEEHLIWSLKNVLLLASDHCDQMYPRDSHYVTADSIIARESIERVKNIVARGSE